MTDPTVLLVEDDPVTRDALELLLSRNRFEVYAATGGSQAIEMIEQLNPDIVVTDIVMEPPNGLAVLDAAKRQRWERPVIMITGFEEHDYAVRALRLRADEYLLKPCGAAELVGTIRRCLERSADFVARCCVCGRVRESGSPDTEEIWIPVEEYLEHQHGVQTTHTYCPACADRILEDDCDAPI